jgi:hypothetical protein
MHPPAEKVKAPNKQLGEVGTEKRVPTHETDDAPRSAGDSDVEPYDPPTYYSAREKKIVDKIGKTVDQILRLTTTSDQEERHKCAKARYLLRFLSRNRKERLPKVFLLEAWLKRTETLLDSKYHYPDIGLTDENLRQHTVSVDGRPLKQEEKIELLKDSLTAVNHQTGYVYAESVSYDLAFRPVSSQNRVSQLKPHTFWYTHVNLYHETLSDTMVKKDVFHMLMNECWKRSNGLVPAHFLKQFIAAHTAAVAKSTTWLNMDIYVLKQIVSSDASLQEAPKFVHKVVVKEHNRKEAFSSTRRCNTGTQEFGSAQSDEFSVCAKRVEVENVRKDWQEADNMLATSGPPDRSSGGLVELGSTGNTRSFGKLIQDWFVAATPWIDRTHRRIYIKQVDATFLASDPAKRQEKHPTRNDFFDGPYYLENCAAEPDLRLGILWPKPVRVIFGGDIKDNLNVPLCSMSMTIRQYSATPFQRKKVLRYRVAGNEDGGFSLLDTRTNVHYKYQHIPALHSGREGKIVTTRNRHYHSEHTSCVIQDIAVDCLQFTPIRKTLFSDFLTMFTGVARADDIRSLLSSIGHCLTRTRVPAGDCMTPVGVEKFSIQALKPFLPLLLEKKVGKNGLANQRVSVFTVRTTGEKDVTVFLSTDEGTYPNIVVYTEQLRMEILNRNGASSASYTATCTSLENKGGFSPVGSTGKPGVEYDRLIKIWLLSLLQGPLEASEIPYTTIYNALGFRMTHVDKQQQNHTILASFLGQIDKSRFGYSDTMNKRIVAAKWRAMSLACPSQIRADGIWWSWTCGIGACVERESGTKGCEKETTAQRERSLQSNEEYHDYKDSGRAHPVRCILKNEASEKQARVISNVGSDINWLNRQTLDSAIASINARPCTHCGLNEVQHNKKMEWLCKTASTGRSEYDPCLVEPKLSYAEEARSLGQLVDFAGNYTLFTECLKWFEDRGVPLGVYTFDMGAKDGTTLVSEPATFMEELSKLDGVSDLEQLSTHLSCDGFFFRTHLMLKRSDRAKFHATLERLFESLKASIYYSVDGDDRTMRCYCNMANGVPSGAYYLTTHMNTDTLCVAHIPAYREMIRTVESEASTKNAALLRMTRLSNDKVSKWAGSMCLFALVVQGDDSALICPFQYDADGEGTPCKWALSAVIRSCGLHGFHAKEEFGGTIMRGDTTIVFFMFLSRLVISDDNGTVTVYPIERALKSISWKFPGAAPYAEQVVSSLAAIIMLLNAHPATRHALWLDIFVTAALAAARVNPLWKEPTEMQQAWLQWKHTNLYQLDENAILAVAKRLLSTDVGASGLTHMFGTDHQWTITPENEPRIIEISDRAGLKTREFLDWTLAEDPIDNMVKWMEQEALQFALGAEIILPQTQGTLFDNKHVLDLEPNAWIEHFRPENTLEEEVWTGIRAREASTSGEDDSSLTGDSSDHGMDTIDESEVEDTTSDETSVETEDDKAEYNPLLITKNYIIPTEPWKALSCVNHTAKIKTFLNIRKHISETRITEHVGVDLQVHPHSPALQQHFSYLTIIIHVDMAEDTVEQRALKEQVETGLRKYVSEIGGDFDLYICEGVSALVYSIYEGTAALTLQRKNACVILYGCQICSGTEVHREIHYYPNIPIDTVCLVPIPYKQEAWIFPHCYADTTCGVAANGTTVVPINQTKGKGGRGGKGKGRGRGRGKGKGRGKGGKGRGKGGRGNSSSPASSSKGKS